MVSFLQITLTDIVLTRSLTGAPCGRETISKRLMLFKRHMPKRPMFKRPLKDLCQHLQTWNNYPEYIKSTETHGQFKTAFYEWKLESSYLLRK